ncbi:MAG: NIPSNAP family protein [Spirochaetaceae bacterium]|nr:NIPSNAP family protein [Myxococcales bacterium]MCB9725486.1 NIPSNAP family protein [Spirochaetaceae bacterium]HPG25713.1 NIPSNAP family protein [Myxococcota bacterium]
MKDQRIYIHEINRLRSGRKTELYQAMESRGVPLYQKHGVELVGYWETIMGHGPWPETISLWEFENFGHYENFLRSTYAPSDGNFDLRDWQEEKSEWYSGTDSYLCLASSATPSVADHRKSGIKAKMIVHETMHTEPNRQAEYCEIATEMFWRRVAEPAGCALIGIFFSPWKNTRAFNFWGMAEEWEDLNLRGVQADGKAWYDAEDSKLWNTLGLAIRSDFDDRFAVPAPFSTVR